MSRYLHVAIQNTELPALLTTRSETPHTKTGITLRRAGNQQLGTSINGSLNPPDVQPAARGIGQCALLSAVLVERWQGMWDRASDVMISVVENENAHWSFGYGRAQFLVEDLCGKNQLNV